MSTASADGAVKLGRLLPWNDGHDEAAAPIGPDFHDCAPLPGAPNMSGEIDTYGITGIPSMVGGRGVVQRAGMIGSTHIVCPGSGREDA